MTRFHLSKKEIRLMTKKQLCDRLGVQHRERRAVTEPLTTDKVCSSRKSRLYPHRFTKEELYHRVRTRHPRFSSSKVKTMKLSQLCRLAGFPFLEIPVSPPRNESSPQRRVSSEHQTRVDSHHESRISCRTRGSKTLLGHQQQLLDRLEHSRGVIGVHATGSGKTLSAVVASQCYLDRHPRHSVVIITPASLVDNIQKELDAFGDTLRHRSRYRIMSYQAFVNRQKSRSPEKHIDCHRTMLIVDEAHNLRTEYKKTRKKTQGIMSKHVVECAEKADKVLLLTATPLINRIEDLTPLLNMIRDEPTVINRLKASYVAKHFFEAPFLEKYVKNRFHFFTPVDDTRREIYPALESEDVFLEMDPLYLQKYDDAENMVASDENIRIFGDVDLKKFFNGVRRATNTLDVSIFDNTRSPKIRWILDFLRKKKTTDKIILYSQFLDMGSSAIYTRLPRDLKETSVFVTGQTPRAQRQQIVDEFNRGDKTILFISKAGGEGLDLKGTTSIILMEPSWNEATEKQVIGRGVRYRSHDHLPFDKRKVRVYHLYLVKPRDLTHLDQILTSDIVYHPEGGYLSADLMLHNIQSRKQKENDIILNLLRHHNV